MTPEESYHDLLSRLEAWVEELAQRGPDGLPEVLREIYGFIEVRQGADYCPPHIDFNHQKNYN